MIYPPFVKPYDPRDRIAHDHFIPVTQEEFEKGLEMVTKTLGFKPNGCYRYWRDPFSFEGEEVTSDLEDHYALRFFHIDEFVRCDHAVGIELVRDMLNFEGMNK